MVQQVLIEDGSHMMMIIMEMLSDPAQDGFFGCLGVLLESFKEEQIYSLELSDDQDEDDPIYNRFVQSRASGCGRMLPCFIVMDQDKIDMVRLIWVHSSMRNLGIGRKLLECMNARVAWNLSDSARGFFEHCGVKEEGSGYNPTARDMIKLCQKLRESQLFAHCQLGKFWEASIRIDEDRSVRFHRFRQPWVVGALEYDQGVDLDALLPDIGLHHGSDINLKCYPPRSPAYSLEEIRVIREAIEYVWPTICLSEWWYV